MSWADLLRHDRLRCEVELAKHGTSIGDLVSDLDDVPELREILEHLSPEAKELLALQYFGDERHPQPEESSRAIVGAFVPGETWSVPNPTPRWDRLPPLDEDEPPEKADDLLGGDPYLKADYEAAGKLHKAGKMTVNGIRERRGLSKTRAHRIHKQFRKGAVVLDDAGLHPGPGFRWDPAGRDDDPPKYKLIRA